MINKFYGNENALKLIDFAAQSGRPNHAYLVYGEKGIGKKTYVGIFAKSILCENKTEGKICGYCKNCVKADKGIHPDIIIAGDEIAGNKNTTRKNSFHVDAVRLMQSDVYIKPNEAKYKIYILHKIENMSEAAVNAILKITEEPPEHIVFFMISENVYELPATVRSRCVHVHIKNVSDEECGEALADKGCPADKIPSIVENCGGNIGRGILMFNNIKTNGEFINENEKIAADIISNLLKKNKFDLITSFAQIDTDRKKTVEIIKCLLLTMRDAVVLKNGGKAVFSLKKEAEKIATDFTEKKIFSIIDSLEYSLDCMEKNGNHGLILSFLSADMMK